MGYRVGDIIEYWPKAYRHNDSFPSFHDDRRHGFAIIVSNPIKGHPRNWPVQWIIPPEGAGSYVLEIGVLEDNILRVVGHCDD